MLNSINTTNALQSAVFALEAILENHPLTQPEFDQLEQAWQGVNTMLSHVNTQPRGVTVAERNEAEMQYVQPAFPFKKETTDLALHRAFVALALEFCTPLTETDGLVEYVNDAASMLLPWAVL